MSSKTLGFVLALLVGGLGSASASARTTSPPPATTPSVPAAEATPPEVAAEPEAAESDELEAAVREALRPDGEERELEPRELVGVLVTTGVAHDDGAPEAAADTAPTGPVPGATQVGDDDAMVYLARATLVVDRRPTERTGLTAAYEGEFERFGAGAELDALNHSFGFAFEHRPSRRSSWHVGGSLLDGEDPGRFLSGVLAILPRSDYRQSRLYTSYGYLWPTSAISLHAGRLQTEIAATPFSRGLATDDTDLYGAVTLDRSLGPRSALSASYTYVRPQSGLIATVDPDDPLGPPLLTDREPLHAATLGLSFRPAAGLALQLSAGVAGDSAERTGIGSAELYKSGESYSVKVRYDRSLAVLGTDPAGARTPAPVEPGLPNAAASDSVTQSLSLGLGVSLTDRWQLEQSVWVARTDLAAGELETLALNGRLVFRLATRVGLFGELDYFDQGGLSGSLVSSRLRYGLGLVFSLAGPGGPRGLLTQRESALRVLPNRGGI